jgi:probable F420-dependent oxidoreductase
MNLRRPGVFAFLDELSGAQTIDFARAVEALGYSALWITEVFGRDCLVHAATLLSHTERLVIATGIANIYKRQPIAMAGAARQLAEQFGDRFVLGLGVSNREVSAARGLGFGKPVAEMRDYLAAMRSAPYRAPAPQTETPIVIAGMRPRMLRLALEETQGTHTYFAPPEFVAKIRGQYPQDKWICAEQAVMLETDPVKARTAAREYMKIYLRLESYRANLRSIDFNDSDFENGGSDRLVDAIVAWGDAETMRKRVAAQYTAGATHVCVLPLKPEGGLAPDLRALEALAPLLTRSS